MASSSAVRAGGAFVELFTRDGNLVKGLERARAKVAAFGQFVAKASAITAGIGASIFTPISALMKNITEEASDLSRTADRLYTTTDRLSAMGHAAKMCGIDVEELHGALFALRDKTDEAAAGGWEAAQAFTRLGVAAGDLLKMPTTDALQLLADKFRAIPNQVTRARLATELFGAAGEKMLPMLLRGSAGIKALSDESRRLGAVIDPDTAKRSIQFTEFMTRGYAALKGIALELVSALIPGEGAMQKMGETIEEVAATVRMFIRENRETISLIVKVGGVAVAAGSALAGLAGLAGGVALAAGALTGISAAVAAVIAVGTAMLELAVPVGVVAASLGDLGLLFFTQTRIGREAAAEIKRAFWDTAGQLREAWGAMGKAINGGNLKLAVKIAFAAVNVAWQQCMVLLAEGWVWFNKTFVEHWHSTILKAKLAWNDLRAAGLTLVHDLLFDFQNLGKTIGDYLTAAFNKATAFGTKAFHDMIDNWRDIAAVAGFFIPGAGAAAALIENRQKIADAAEKAQAEFNAAGEQLGAAAGKGPAAIEAERKAREQEIRDKAEADRLAREKGNADFIAGREGILAAAKAELQKLIKEANDMQTPELKKPPGLPGEWVRNPEGMSITSSKGSFVADAAGTHVGAPDKVFVGILTVNQKQLEMLQKIAERVGANAMGAGNGPKFGILR